MRTTAPYGTWISPITSEWLTLSQKKFGTIVIDADTIYWDEVRPNENGRTVIVQVSPEGEKRDITPDNLSVRTRIHEYGGAPFTAYQGKIYFINDKDQRIYLGTEALTEPGVRFADLHVYENYLIAVGEKEHDNFLICFDLRTKKWQKIASGNDFYASPAFSKDGTQVAFITWNHPQMPWDGSELWLGDFKNGQLSNLQKIAGSSSESIFQPCWSASNELHFVSDITGWWNLYRWNETIIPKEFQNLVFDKASAPDLQQAQPTRKQAMCKHMVDGRGCKGGDASAVKNQILKFLGYEPVCPREAEFGLPQWIFGMSTYAFAGDQIIAASAKDGRWSLGLSPDFKPLELPWTYFSQIRASNKFAVFIAGSSLQDKAIYHYDLKKNRTKVLAHNVHPHLDPGYISEGQFITYPSRKGRQAHAFYYPPKNTDFKAPDSTLPPLVVMTHGGPTSSTSSTFDLKIQFWTSRGIAVLDVDYGGSTGYGRPYRDALKGNWGIVDVEDCEAGAQYLVDHKKADPKKLAIRGGSAGGYTTLAALTFGKTFTVGASYYGVSDLTALAEETHKFEARYLDSLVGPYPAQKKLYQDRSPLYHAEKLKSPVIFFQGSEDLVVPLNQAEKMYEALKKRGIMTKLVVYEGEQHGFRKAQNIRDSLEKELAFYLKAWNLA
ncbi:MAG TPA: S9 family peptidase [Rhabdochlamydiaceae bacterium]|nr:S9 family peptidase [Rhabdochlamydiaceae bacterium]